MYSLTKALNCAKDALQKFSQWEVNFGWEGKLFNPRTMQNEVIDKSEYKGFPANDALTEIARLEGEGEWQKK